MAIILYHLVVVGTCTGVGAATDATTTFFLSISSRRYLIMAFGDSMSKSSSNVELEDEKLELLMLEMSFSALDSLDSSLISTLSSLFF